MSACSRFSEGPPEKGPTEGTKGRAGLAGEARRHPTTAGGLEEEGRRLGRPLHGETETFLPAKTVRSNNNVGQQTEKPVERQEVERTNWRRRWREREGREKENRRANPGYVKQNYWLSGILITCRINGAVR